MNIVERLQAELEVNRLAVQRIDMETAHQTSHPLTDSIPGRRPLKRKVQSPSTPRRVLLSPFYI